MEEGWIQHAVGFVSALHLLRIWTGTVLWCPKCGEAMLRPRWRD